MGQTLEAVLDEIGYVDKKVLEAERKEAFEKIAKLAMEAEMAKIDKERLKKEKAKAETEKARIVAENIRIEADKARIAAEKVQAEAEKVQAEAKKDQAEVEKAQLEVEKAQMEAETTNIRKNLLEAVFDMLYRGTPPALVSKWTGLPEDNVLRLKAEMDITSVEKI